MSKIDIIVSWPRNADYPVWKQFIKDNRERFNLVIVVFTETHHGDDYRAFVRGAMAEDWVLFIDNPVIGPGEDWRDVAIKRALLQSYNAEWVWFTEQDFFPKDNFWETVEDRVQNDLRCIAVKQGDRIHPCSLFLRRDLLNEIAKNFAAKPQEYDHFGAIQKQLEERGESIGLISSDYWQHLNGLSHNMRLVADSEKPNYQPEIFNKYISESLKVTVPLDPRFERLMVGYLAYIGYKPNAGNTN